MEPIAEEWLDAEWRKNYGGWDRENLETHKVIVPKPHSVFVHRTHPVVGLLRYNEDMIGIKVDEHIDSVGYLVLDHGVFNAMCGFIRDKVLGDSTNTGQIP